MSSAKWIHVLLFVVMAILLPGNKCCDVSKCPEPDCNSPIIKEGTCCPECPCMHDGVSYDIEDIVQTGDNCEVCECTEFGVACLRPPCPPVHCSHTIIPEGSCCETCGCLVDGVSYEMGFQVLSKDPCKECRCGYDGNVDCMVMTCPEVKCSHPYRPRRECCKQCGCHRGRQQFDFGPINRKDDCEPECVCNTNGTITCEPLEYECAPVSCPRKLRYIPPGQCCPACRCYQNKEWYNAGDEMPVPAKQKCTAKCYCGVDGIRVCEAVECPPVDCSDPVVVPGECCPSCGCLKKKTLYQFGPILDDPCQPCECHTNGSITCARRQKCPHRKPCQHGVYRPENGTAECCPKCQCKFHGKMHAPGEVFDGPNCETCECHSTSGRISCEKKPCPAEPLRCANPKMSDSCVPECPDGPTCMYKKHVLKYGTYKRFGKHVCTCLGDPWFPNAFCAPHSIDKKHKKKWGGLIGEYGYPKSSKAKKKT